MRLTEMNLFEATNLYCSNCDADLGKDTENCRRAFCGRCGSYTRNPRGDDCDTEVDDAPVAAAPEVKVSSAPTAPPKFEDMSWSLAGNGDVVRSIKGFSNTKIGSVKATPLRLNGEKIDGFAATRLDGDRKLFTKQKNAFAWVRSIDIRRMKADFKKQK